MKNALLVALTAFVFSNSYSQTTYTLDSTIIESRVVKDSLDIPWEIIWGPDDHIWVTERFGRVSRIDPVSGEQKVLLNISSDVYERSEAGMLGMVLHPDFSNTPHVFVAYTYLFRSNIYERLVKFNYNGSRLTPLDTLIEGIKGNTTHIGCRLLILPDNTLLMTTGDAQDRPLSQDTNSLVGKILRMNLDGSVPSDNPFPRSLVYTIGHRNAQGLWRLPDGKIISSEHGPTTDDEINYIQKGRNYGWPDVVGYCDSPAEIRECAAKNIVEPIAGWTPTIAPSDIIYYTHTAIPEFTNRLLMTVLKDKSLRTYRITTTADSATAEKIYLKDKLGRLRDVCISPDGRIFLATNGASWSNNNPFTHSIVELKNQDASTHMVQLEKEERLLKIGPNPLLIGQPLNLLPGEEVEGAFRVFDLTGRPVLESFISSDTKLNIPQSSGVYIWKFVDERGQVQEGKLIVQ
jgi:glucose/arabinose dehydrogenase